MLRKLGYSPVYENQFQVNKGTAGVESLVDIADMESFSVSFDNGVEEWKPFDQKRLDTPFDDCEVSYNFRFW